MAERIQDLKFWPPVAAAAAAAGVILERKALALLSNTFPLSSEPVPDL